MSNSNPTLRALDPVIEERIARIQRTAFEAAAIVETVKCALRVHQDESIGNTPVIALVDALAVAQATLDGVTDRLDTVNLKDGSRLAVVASPRQELEVAA